MVYVHTILRDVAGLFKVGRLVAYAGNWWRMGLGPDPQTQAQPTLPPVLACGQKAVVAANALLRAMRA